MMLKRWPTLLKDCPIGEIRPCFSAVRETQFWTASFFAPRLRMSPSHECKALFDQLSDEPSQQASEGGWAACFRPRDCCAVLSQMKLAAA
jgi:hypothetical protein